MDRFNEIILEVKLGRRGGFEWLFKRYGEKLLAIALNKWSFSEDDGYEMIYKTFEAIAKNGHKYDFKSLEHFENFLFKVYLNNLRELYRSKINLESKVTISSLSDFDPSLISSNEIDSLEEEIPINKLLDRLQSALKELTVEQRDLLLLRAQNFSYHEIARYLGIKEESLRVKHLRAKNRLLKILSDHSNALKI